MRCDEVQSSLALAEAHFSLVEHQGAAQKVAGVSLPCPLRLLGAFQGIFGQ
jgi:hypothetical protein